MLGSLNVDLVLRVERFPKAGETLIGRDFHRRPGGKGANQAVAVAAHVGHVRMVGSVGDDEVGRTYRAALAQRGVDTADVSVQEEMATEHAVIILDNRGENRIVVVPGANGMPTPAVVDRLQPSPGDVVMLQLETPLEIVSRAIATAKEAGATVMLNLSPFQLMDEDLLASCNVVVVNETENAQLESAGIRHGSVVVTKGADGATWGGAHASARAARVVDSTGAGDAFAGALAAAIAAGRNRQAALEQAVRTGARAVEHEGAQDWEL